MSRPRYQRDPEARRLATEVTAHAERLARKSGLKRDALNAISVAADAWEEAGDLALAQHLRFILHMKGRSMAYVKQLSLQLNGSPFFSRETRRFFGPEQTYGPYVGIGGVFFVTRNRAGVALREMFPDGSIATIGRVDVGLDGVREEAKYRAGALSYSGSATPFPTVAERKSG